MLEQNIEEQRESSLLDGDQEILTRFQDEDNFRWYAKSRDHFLAGDCYISVTKAMDHIQAEKMQSYFKKNSFASQSKTLSTTAATGTAIHKVIEDDLSGLPPILDHTTTRPYEQWLKVKHEHHIQAQHTEKGMWSELLGMAGTADIIGWMDSQLCVMDLKTGFYSVKAGWQMAAYHWMAIEQEISPPDVGMAGIQVHRDGSKANVFKYQHIESCMKAFIACLESFKMLYYTKLSKMNWKFLNLNSMETFIEKKGELYAVKD